MPKRDILLCMGGVNAKLGNANDGFSECIGVHGVGKMNDNGVRFVTFCLAKELMISKKLFKHRDIHKYTWTSPCGKHHNQIDYLAINIKYKYSLLDIRSLRGADIRSDHQLLVSTLRHNLNAKKNNVNIPPKYDIEKLRQQSSG
ncbi:craniofacial development protein 2-like [Palaemon carinicauda]|uniref:craniofacial development protein 2-like n=1 Tax=Palaemon carinicauda TaxID=392227 RepID=UPI0035B592EB